VYLAVDRARCTGHARCHAVAPEVFELDDRGYVALPLRPVVAPQSEEAARRGVDACPERALRLEVEEGRPSADVEQAEERMRRDGTS
jgi:ferredoxin